jgi:hypothetical protein
MFLAKINKWIKVGTWHLLRVEAMRYVPNATRPPVAPLAVLRRLVCLGRALGVRQRSGDALLRLRDLSFGTTRELARECATLVYTTCTALCAGSPVSDLNAEVRREHERLARLFVHSAELSLSAQSETARAGDHSTARRGVQKGIAKRHDGGDGGVGGDADRTNERLSEIWDRDREAIRLYGDAGRVVGELASHPLEISDRRD